jgi:outer membrane protein assembly factor BamB
VARLARIGALVAVAVAVVAGPVSPALGSAGDWPQLRYSAAENPFNPAETTISASNVGSLRTAWVRQFPTAKFIGVPIVSGGHVFSLISGGVISMKSTTGKTRWRIQLAGVNSGGIAAAGAVVYVTTLNHLYALDGATGAQLWDIQRPFGNGSVVVSGGTVYVGYNPIYAIDAATGEERWHFDTGWGGPFPVIANGIVYTRQTDQLVALDANSGDVLWTVPGEMPVLLYKASLYTVWGLHSLGAATGTQNWWNQDVIGAFVAGPGRVYASTTVTEGWAALNAGTGHIVWTMPVGVQNAALANGVIYTTEGHVSGEATIRARDATTGAELATLPGHSGPIISHGVIYTVDNHINGDGAPTLYALKP